MLEKIRKDTLLTDNTKYNKEYYVTTSKRAGDEKCLEFVSACPGGELLPVWLEGAVVLPHPRILALEAPLPRPPAVLYHVILLLIIIILSPTCRTPAAP